MRSVPRILVTGAGGQVGVDLLDVLAGHTPLGGDPAFQPDGQALGSNEFDLIGLTHHDLDIQTRPRSTAPLAIVVLT